MIDWLIVSMITILGVVVSYEDIRFGKIRNTFIIMGFISSIIIYSSLYFMGIVQFNHLIFRILIVLSVLCIGILLWLLGMWSPGDAKLVTMVSSLIPLNIDKPIFSISMNLILYPILLAFVYSIFSLFIKSDKKQKSNAIKAIFSIKRIMLYLLYVLSFGWLLKLILNYVGISSNYFLLSIGLIILSKLNSLLIEKYGKKFNLSEMHTLIVFFILQLFFSFKEYLSFVFWKDILLITFLLYCLRTFMYELSNIYIINIPIKNLKEGMIPAEILFADGTKKPIGNYGLSNIKFSNDETIFEAKLSGFTKKDIITLKSFAKKHKSIKKIMIQQSMWFAPFIFLGALITLF